MGLCFAFIFKRFLSFRCQKVFNLALSFFLVDYAALHLKIGLEIHQQLAGNKLFCSCPAEIVDTTADFNVMRQLQASRSELGTVDAAALYEQEKKKFFLYKVYHTTNCLVELDEEPPHAVNFDTLRCALQVAHLLHCSIVDEI